MQTAAIIVAGGSGTRMGSEMPKQFLPLLGRPLLFHTLQAFQDTPAIQQIVLVLPAPTLDWFQQAYPVHLFSKLTKITPGGKTRQDSTFAGFQALKGSVDYVLVHDGARPLIEISLIERTLQAAIENGAALAACPAKDTLKQIDLERFVCRTHPREQVYHAQTPQAFRYSLLKEALHRADQEGIQGTDESSLVERLGAKIKIVEGNTMNLKVTTPEDLWIAEAFLEKRKRSKKLVEQINPNSSSDAEFEEGRDDSREKDR